MHGGADVMSQDLGDFGQSRHAAFVQVGEKFILIFL